MTYVNLGIVLDQDCTSDKFIEKEGNNVRMVAGNFLNCILLEDSGAVLDAYRAGSFFRRFIFQSVPFVYPDG
jgi:hypothetical protein